MKERVSIQTKSFVFLFSLILIGALVSIFFTGKKSPWFQGRFEQIALFPYKKPNIAPVKKESSQPLPDTSDWKDTSLEGYGIAFKVKPDWQVSSPKKEGTYEVVEVDPGKKYYNFKIYISRENFYAMDDLPAEDITIGGKPGKKVSDLLYGVNSGSYFFTFDIGQSLALWPEFKAMANSVTFNGNF